jgi:site-specific recombinase XerC
VRIRREIAKGGRTADVFLPAKLVTKLKRLWTWKRRRGESLAADAPLFCNQSGQRVSRRRVQDLWRKWQVRAGFDRLYPLHALRHYAEFRIMWSRARQVMGSGVNPEDLWQAEQCVSA